MLNLTKKIAVVSVALIAVGGSAFATSGAAQAAPAAKEQSLVQKVDHRGGRQEFGRGHDRGGRHDAGRGRGHGGRHDMRGPGRFHGHVLGERQVRRILRHQGYRHIRVMDRRGPVYVVKANGWRGMRERLVVDARSGHVVGRKVLGNRHGGGFHWSYRW